MNEWLEVLKNPTLMIPAIISAFFTLLGAFGGVYLSSKSANKLSRFNRIMDLNQDLHEFKLIVDGLELQIPYIYSYDKIDSFTKANLSIMIEKVKEAKYITRIIEVEKPAIIDVIDIENLKESLNFLEYCINEKKDEEMIFYAYKKYKSEIMRFKIALDVVYKI